MNFVKWGTGPLPQGEASVSTGEVVATGDIPLALADALRRAEPLELDVDTLRRDLLAIREREIMQNRIASNYLKGKRYHARPLTYTEKLKMRLDINKSLPKEKP